MDVRIAKRIFNVINTAKVTIDKSSCSDSEILKELSESMVMLSDYIKNNFNLYELSYEELEWLGFKPFNLNNGIKIMLIPDYLYSSLPRGTRVISVRGDVLVLGTNKIDVMPFSGHLAYGLIHRLENDNLVYERNMLSVAQTIYLGKVRKAVSDNFSDFINTVNIHGATGRILYTKESHGTGRRKYYRVKEKPKGYLEFDYIRIRDEEEIKELILLCTTEDGVINTERKV